MKLAGFLLLISGWVIAVAAVVLLEAARLRMAFVLAGLAVQALGVALVFRSHLILDEERQ